jgi:hypothetical protein
MLTNITCSSGWAGSKKNKMTVTCRVTVIFNQEKNRFIRV